MLAGLGRVARNRQTWLIAIAGLAAWHYRGGPWELAWQGRFRG